MRRKLNMFMALGLGLGVVVPAAGASSLEEGLIAWWRMELRQGSTIPDASGNCHDLTINGSPTFDGSVVIFNDDGTLEAADSDALDLMGDWTVSYWVRENSHDHSPNSNPTNGLIDKHRSNHDAEGGWSRSVPVPADHPYRPAMQLQDPACRRRVYRPRRCGQCRFRPGRSRALSNARRFSRPF